MTAFLRNQMETRLSAFATEPVSTVARLYCRVRSTWPAARGFELMTAEPERQRIGICNKCGHRAEFASVRLRLRLVPGPARWRLCSSCDHGLDSGRAVSRTFDHGTGDVNLRGVAAHFWRCSCWASQAQPFVT